MARGKTQTKATALSVDKLSVRFGGLLAIDSMSFDVHEGEVLSLIGPNGAGKTTAFNVITGYIRPSGGKITYRGNSLIGLKPYEIAALNVVRTFQKTSVFGGQTAFDNVLMGLHLRQTSKALHIIFALPSVVSEERKIRETAREVLDFVGLGQRADELGSALAYGEQRLLEVAVALAARPNLLLLDEPVSGMNPVETANFMKILGEIRKLGITILLVEHDMKMVMGVSDRIIVLNHGSIIANGSPAEIQNNPDVIRAYLGERYRKRKSGAKKSGTKKSGASKSGAKGRSVLKIEGLTCAYGKVTAVRGLSMEVREGELVTLIGANGAGKTTTLKTISGVLAPLEGRIEFDGEDITGASARTVLELGIAHCPEGRRIFPYMTVRENLEMGCYLRSDASEIAEDMEKIFDRFPILNERRAQAAGTLSGGEQQMLAISRALMSRPRLILFDEPSLGLAPNLVERTFDIIEQIRSEGVTIVMVEQNALAALELCDRSYVLESGEVTLSGTGSKLLKNKKVQQAYLGG